MRLAISNIAWNVDEDAAIAELLQRYKVDAIDVAPGKYFPEPTKATADKIAPIRDWWGDRGIEITGMQALLFGTQGLNLFGSVAVQQKMLSHLAAVCRIGAGLGATRLVFGSPKNRDRTGLSDDKTLEIAIDFFHQLGDIAFNEGVQVCLEPNPPCYGANFMSTSAETAEVVMSVNHPAIRMQLDTGALTINSEDIEQVLKQSNAVIGHIHASEPNLLTLGDGTTNHAQFGKEIKQYLPNHIVSIEMLASKEESHLTAIERALVIASRYYRNTDNQRQTL
jgi:D-psicose/D-tagatose/L-ribulose 3-epimerase